MCAVIEIERVVRMKGQAMGEILGGSAKGST